MTRATGRSARSAPSRGLLLGRRVLLGDDLVLDLLVGGARQDLLGDQLVLPLVGPVVDDLLRQRVADAGQLLEVLVARAVEVELLLHRLAGTALGLGTVALGRGLWRRAAPVGHWSPRPTHRGQQPGPYIDESG